MILPLTRLIVVTLLAATPLFAESSKLFLFKSSKARADLALTRRKAWLALARHDYDRAARLKAQSAISDEEFEDFRAALALAQYDLRIAELKAKQSDLSLQMAAALDRNGRKIPLCQRRKQKEDDTVSRLLKRSKKMEPPKLPESPEGSGTKVQVAEGGEAPPAPEAPEKPNPPEAPENPVSPGEKPSPGGEEPPEPPQEKPSPGAKPTQPPKPGSATPPPAKPGAQPPKPGGKPSGSGGR